MSKQRYMVSDWFRFYAPRFLALTLLLGLIVRIILVFHPLTVVDWGFAEWVKIFGLGLVNDIAFTAIALVPAFLVYTLLTRDKYRQPYGYILWGLLLVLTLYVLLCNDITDEYGGPLPRIVNALLTVFLICATVKLFIPAVRDTWRRIAIYVVMMVYACCAVTIAFSEVVFWSEFGVRFNFIAVDYLVYTNEVIGNIVESYPIVWMVLAMLLVAGAICWLMVRGKYIRESGVSGWKQWGLTLAVLALWCGLGYGWLHLGYRNFGGENLFAT